MDTNLTTIQDKALTSAREIGQLANEMAARLAFADYRSRKADNTTRRQDNDLSLFANYLAGVGIAVNGELNRDASAWLNVTWGLVEGFVKAQLHGGYSVSSVNVRLSTIKTYAKLAAKAGGLSSGELAMIRTISGYSRKEAKRIDEDRESVEIPIRYIPKYIPEKEAYEPIAAKKSKAVTLNREQIAALKNQPTDTPQGRRDKLLVCLLVNHGLRCSEVALLQVKDFAIDKGEFTFYRPKVDKTQTHRMTSDTLQAVKEYLANDGPEDGPLFITTRRGGYVAMDGTQGMSERAITKRVRTLGEQAGIKGLSAHDLRHTWATIAAPNTSIDRLMEAGGWSSYAMPLRYIEAAKIANEGVRLE